MFRTFFLHHLLKHSNGIKLRFLLNKFSEICDLKKNYAQICSCDSSDELISSRPGFHEFPRYQVKTTAWLISMKQYEAIHLLNRLQNNALKATKINYSSEIMKWLFFEWLINPLLKVAQCNIVYSYFNFTLTCYFL